MSESETDPQGASESDELSDEELEASFRFLFKLARRKSSSTGKHWAEGEVPIGSPALVIGDGLASRSTTLAIPPWIVDVRKIFDQKVPCAQLRQFSFFKAGFHYDGRQTTLAFDDVGKRLSDYLPAKQQTTGFMAFSLACPSFVFKIHEWLHGGGRGIIPCLVLLQPAFAVKPRISAAWHRFPEYTVSGGALDALDPAETTEFQQRVIDAVKAITQTIPVHIRFWPGDRFLDYDRAFIDRLLKAGADVAEIKEVSFHLDDPFQEHCRLSRDSDVLADLADLVYNCLCAHPTDSPQTVSEVSAVEPREFCKQRR